MLYMITIQLRSAGKHHLRDWRTPSPRSPHPDLIKDNNDHGAGSTRLGLSIRNDRPKLSVVIHDDYMTPFSAWEDVSAYIPRHLTLWEAFYGDGTSGTSL